MAAMVVSRDIARNFEEFPKKIRKTTAYSSNIVICIEETLFVSTTCEQKRVYTAHHGGSIQAGNGMRMRLCQVLEELGIQGPGLISLRRQGLSCFVNCII